MRPPKRCQRERARRCPATLTARHRRRADLLLRWSADETFHSKFIFALALNNSVRGLPIDIVALARNTTRAVRKREMDGSVRLSRARLRSRLIALSPGAAEFVARVLGHLPADDEALVRRLAATLPLASHSSSSVAARRTPLTSRSR